MKDNYSHQSLISDVLMRDLHSNNQVDSSQTVICLPSGRCFDLNDIGGNCCPFKRNL